MKTLTDKFNLLLEGKFSKEQFLRDARLECPDIVSKHNTYDDAVSILKNRGLISLNEGRKKKEDREYNYATIDRFPAEAVKRGVDVELENMGLDSVEISTEEEYNKAMDKALKNLEKDFNFYLNKITDTKSSRKRTDVMVPAEKSNVIDKDNGMTVVKQTASREKLAEQVLKESIKTIIGNILDPKTKNIIKEENDQSSRETSFKVKNALSSVLSVIDDVVDMETIDSNFIDEFIHNLEAELTARSEEKENLFSEPLSERKKFTYQGKIL